MSIYTGGTACLASANNLTVRKISVGFDLGNILGYDLNCLVKSVVERSNTDVVTKVR